MKIFSTLFFTGVAVFAVLQFVRPEIPTRQEAAPLQAPPAVKQILEKSCFSCHSNQRRLSWFDEIVPAYWLVRHDILTAREHLNFSTIGTEPQAVQKAKLYEAVNMIQLGAMPLPNFLRMHPEARVTPEELETLKAYLDPWASTANLPINSTLTHSTVSSSFSRGQVQPELNGIPFDSTFVNWKPISFTDRGDNNTFRFILGNEIAIDAAKSGNISPWPDGSRFAKIAWQREIGRDGLLYPGKFVQVELMVKDAKGQQENEGWAWGRWRSLELKPYGKDATFVKECTGCHKPMKDDDYVYTMPLTQATVSRNEVVNNRAAILPDGLPQQPLGWNAITMYVDPRSRTISCLYGNDGAMHAINDWKIHSSDMSATLTYPPGAIMSLVTWSERDDPHWFGARIPDKVESVEFVQVVNATRMDYHRFTGTQTTEDRLQQNFEEQRIKFILALKPAALP